ncbi:unnamed protein product [Lampetra planeri]
MEVNTSSRYGLLANASQLTSIQSSNRKKMAMFSAMLLLSLSFTFLVLYLMLRNYSLREKLRFVLLVTLLLSQVMFNTMQCLFYLLELQQIQLSRIMCTVYFTFLSLSSFSELYSIAAMSVDKYVAICWVLRYNEICSIERFWKVVAIVVLMASSSSLLQLVLRLATPMISEDDPPGQFAYCSIDSLNAKSLIVRSIVNFLNVLPILISIVVLSVCYCLISREGKRNGSIRVASKRARYTVMFHSLQVSFYVLPIFLYYVEKVYFTIAEGTVEPLLILKTIVFGAAQGLSPIVYGLRADELREALLRVLCKNRRVSDIHGHV